MRPKVLGTIGQAIVDIIHQSEDAAQGQEALTRLGLSPHPHQHISEQTSLQLRASLPANECYSVCGGSALNSVIAYRCLGGTAKAFVRLGTDALGKEFEADLKDRGIQATLTFDSARSTAHSIILSNPKSGRSMATCLGAANHFDKNEITSDFLTNCDALFIEGYMLALESGEPLATYTDAAKLDKHTAVSLAAPWIISKFRSRLLEALAHSQVVFANEEEAAELTGAKDPRENVGRIAKLCIEERSKHPTTISSSPDSPLVLVTAGAAGAFYGNEHAAAHVPAPSAKVVDVTGAGDAFAGGFLFAHFHGASTLNAVQSASALAAAVISQVGARVTPAMAEKWKQQWDHTLVQE